MGIVRRLGVTALALALAGCTVTRVETPDPAAVPSGPLEGTVSDATGPVVELGSGTIAGLGWRYSIYPSEDGLCTQLETVEVTAGGCGDLLPAEGKAFGGVGRGQAFANGVIAVEGIVSDETVTVSLTNESGFRLPAQHFPLDEAGLEGQAFLAFVPPDVVITHVQAIARSGEVLETYELP
jgi:hypothetical protein